jgi:hypothetical protein
MYLTILNEDGEKKLRGMLPRDFLCCSTYIEEACRQPDPKHVSLYNKTNKMCLFSLCKVFGDFWFIDKKQEHQQQQQKKSF